METTHNLNRRTCPGTRLDQNLHHAELELPGTTGSQDSLAGTGRLQHWHTFMLCHRGQSCWEHLVLLFWRLLFSPWPWSVVPLPVSTDETSQPKSDGKPAHWAAPFTIQTPLLILPTAWKEHHPSQTEVIHHTRSSPTLPGRYNGHLHRLQGHPSGTAADSWRTMCVSLLRCSPSPSDSWQEAATCSST